MFSFLTDDTDMDEELEFSLPHYGDHRDEEITDFRPTYRDIQDWICDISMPLATDECIVEPDGVCEHGHKSWMTVLGY